MLRARLTGGLEVELDGMAVDARVTQRPWAVFGYLALAPESVPRGELASRFWPDVLDQSARGSLRSALWSLRRHLGDRVLVDGEFVSLRDEEGLWIDMREFEQLAPRDPERALELCRGELLEGLEDEWALAARQRHRERVIQLLEELAHAAEQRDDQRSAIELTRRQVDNDPFDEEAHRRLMTRLAAAGDRSAAVRAYRAFAERLRRELGVAPSARTRELIEELRAEDAAPTSPTPPSPPAGLLPLLGREHELAELEQVWRGVTAGSGAVAAIRGEAGIGKTRLATELRQRASAAGGQSAASAALDLGGAAPLSLWAELIHELLPGLAPPPPEAGWPEDLAALASELPSHFDRGGGPSAAVAPDLQRTRLFEAVVAMLGWAARERPLLLVFEDIHSADAPSLELLGYSARRLASLRVMMLLTRRALPHSAEADLLEHALRSRELLALELDLGPLPANPIATLARKAAPLEEMAVAQVVQRAEGNPLLAVETARALGRGRDAVAPSIRGMVRATLSPLAGEVRKLLETAAVAARPLELGELRLLSTEDPDTVAEEALQTGLLQAEAGRVGFRHALLREAVYEEVAEPRRRGLHQLWARTMLASEQAGAIPRPAEVARQLRLAGNDAEAVPQLVRAAESARRLAALEQAVAYLEEALAIVPDRADLWLELAEVEAWRPHRDEAEVAFTQALALLEGGDPLEVARGWLRRARAYHGAICLPRAVLESASQAIELIDRAEQPAPDERSEALAARAWAEAVSGSVEEAERLLAELSAESHESDDLRTYDVGHARALALMRRGNFADSYAPSIASGEAIEGAGRPDLAYGCWANAAGAAAATGDYRRALEFLDRGVAAVDGRGLQNIEVHLLGVRSFVLTRLGRLADARRAVDREQALAEQLGQSELLAMAHHDGGLVALEEKEFALAADVLARSLVGGAHISRPLTRLALAEALARTGEVDRAQDEVRATVLEPVRPSDFPEALVPRLARVQALIAFARDQSEEAERRIEEAIAGWERLLEHGGRAESMTNVLADLGRPVVGLIEPERELDRARADLQAIKTAAEKGRSSALIP